MKYLLLLVFLFSPLFVAAQADPLAAQYQPSIDCTPGDYPNFSFAQMTGPLVKLRQDEPFSDLSTQGNTPCLTIHIFPNEFQGFWVHLTGSVVGALTNVQISWATLPTKITGPGGNAVFCSVSTDCMIYAANYIVVPSNKLSCNTNDPANHSVCARSNVNVYGSAGNYPDPLVPNVDPYYSQTTNAFPLSVAMGQNQSIFVDTHASSSLPSGWYLGQIQVSWNGSAPCNVIVCHLQMPVLFAVWQWPQSQGGFMPSTSSLQNDYYMINAGTGGFCGEVYGDTTCSSYPGTTNGNVADLIAICLDHRIACDPFNTDSLGQSLGGGTSTTFDTVYGPFFNGTTGHVTTILSNPKLTARSLICSGRNWTTSCLQNWFNHFQTQGWLSTLNFYPHDEFNDSRANVNTTNTLSRTAQLALPILWTMNFIDLAEYNVAGGGPTDFRNLTDWLIEPFSSMEKPCSEVGTTPPAGCPVPEPGVNQRSTISTWLTSTGCMGCSARKIGQYITNAESGGLYYSSWPFVWTQPNYALDGLPVANEMAQVLDYWNNVSFDLYYGVDNAITAGGNTWTAANLYFLFSLGDGTLFYPCSGSLSHGHYVGVTTPIWCPSLRLKFIRDGMEYYEYLHALHIAGQDSFITTELAKFIDPTNGLHSFNTNPVGSGTWASTLPQVRVDLGNQLHQLTFPNSAPSTPQGNLPVELRLPQTTEVATLEN